MRSVSCHNLQMKEMDQSVDTDLISKWFQSGDEERAKTDAPKVVRVCLHPCVFVCALVRVVLCA